jgi:hypothetical protein
MPEEPVRSLQRPAEAGDDVLDQGLGAASSVASGGMTPSPLSALAEKILAVSAASASGDGRGVLLAEVGEDLRAEARRRLALGRGVVDGGERQSVAALEQVTGHPSGGRRPT